MNTKVHIFFNFLVLFMCKISKIISETYYYVIFYLKNPTTDSRT